MTRIQHHQEIVCLVPAAAQSKFRARIVNVHIPTRGKYHLELLGFPAWEIRVFTLLFKNL